MDCLVDGVRQQGLYLGEDVRKRSLVEGLERENHSLSCLLGSDTYSIYENGQYPYHLREPTKTYRFSPYRSVFSSCEQLREVFTTSYFSNKLHLIILILSFSKGSTIHYRCVLLLFFLITIGKSHSCTIHSNNELSM